MAGVAGRSGRTPKREDQRRTHYKLLPATKGVIETRVKQPRIRKDIHPLAKSWYKSLAKSGQAEFYTESDWRTALVAAEVLNDYLETKRATLLSEFNRMCAALLATEGDRRRLRIELERQKPREETVNNALYLDEYRRRLRSGE